jgi:hypothetical protein
VEAFEEDSSRIAKGMMLAKAGASSNPVVISLESDWAGRYNSEKFWMTL